jgi:hypothetical protein
VNESVEQKLSEMTAKKLVEIILSALDTMEEAEQTDFIAKHIDARESLARLGADNPEAFLKEVEKFCLDCLNETYYTDEDDIEEYFSSRAYDSHYYDDEWDYDEYYDNTEWAAIFAKLFKLSVMYIRSGDIATGYEANARLLSCLKEMMSDDRYLGTDNPMEYISADWDELFALHYGALFQYHTDTDRATQTAFRCWASFGDHCAEGFLSNVKDIAAAERFILDGLKDSQDWSDQRKCFELLAQLYARLGLDFDKAASAEKLIRHNVNFYLFVVEGLCEQERWQSAALAANKALDRMPASESDASGSRQKYAQREIRTAIRTNLVNAYEKLSDFERAFETAEHMFRDAPDFELYKRARALAEKGADALAFLASVEDRLKSPNAVYGQEELLCNIYSYEGEIQKLIDTALSKETDRNYYTRKYTALALIYRAANGMENLGEALSEYLRSGSDQAGVADMLNPGGDTAHRTELLMRGVDLLREIAEFHIGAAKRTRYAKAAYYMCVIRDIYACLEREDEFRHYFRDIIAQNSRRPALRDEMSVVYGKTAAMIKK